MIEAPKKPEYTESSVKIYFTDNYSLFNFMKGNRDLNEKKIKRIQREIENGNNLLKHAPIIVDREFTILDGQHRFLVSKLTKNPVFFVIRDKMDIAQVAKLNSNTSNWKAIDYLYSYVAMNNEHYLKLEELLKEYKCNLMTLAAMLYKNTPRGRDVKEEFREGDFEVKHLEKTLEILELAKDFKGYVPNPYSSRFLTVIQRLIAWEEYDHELMIKKLEMSGMQIDRLSSPKTIIMQMEEIINYKNSKTRIRLM